MSTVLGAVPSMINPPIITLSPLWTNPLVEMLLNSDSGLASASNTSTNPTPVPPSAPVTIPVYPPGGRVIRIADSKAQLGGGPACPGLAVHGSNPVAAIAAAPSQKNPEQLGKS